MKYMATVSQEVGNPEQKRVWNGPESDHWTDFEDHYNAVVTQQHSRLMEAAQVGPTNRVLDVGCGCGESTRDATRIAISGFALGVDLSERMIARARERADAEGLANIAFEAQMPRSILSRQVPLISSSVATA